MQIPLDFSTLSQNTLFGCDTPDFLAADSPLVLPRWANFQLEAVELEFPDPFARKLTRNDTKALQNRHGFRCVAREKLVSLRLRRGPERDDDLWSVLDDLELLLEPLIECGGGFSAQWEGGGFSSWNETPVSNVWLMMPLQAGQLGRFDAQIWRPWQRLNRCGGCCWRRNTEGFWLRLRARQIRGWQPLVLGDLRRQRNTLTTECAQLARDNSRAALREPVRPFAPAPLWLVAAADFQSAQNWQKLAACFDLWPAPNFQTVPAPPVLPESELRDWEKREFGQTVCAEVEFEEEAREIRRAA